MALVFQDEEDHYAGMTLAIYHELDNQLSPPLLLAIDEADKAADEELKSNLEKALGDARQLWEKMSYAIAKGAIEHIQKNMEIHGIETKGEVDGSQVAFTQVDGTGYVK